MLSIKVDRRCDLEKLTDKQKNILWFIKWHNEQHGYPPTLQEIANQFGMRWRHAVLSHLIALEKKGYIKREKNRSRAITILSKEADL